MKVLWTHTAVKQRNQIFTYWDNRNESNSYSNKLRKKIAGRILLLKRFPSLGKKSSFLNYRFVPMGHFSLYYKIEKDCIYITAFWDNRQDPRKLLNFLK